MEPTVESPTMEPAPTLEPDSTLEPTLEVMTMEPTAEGTGNDGPGLICGGITEEMRTIALTERLSLITPIDNLLDPDQPVGMAYEYIVFNDPAQLCPNDEPQLTQRYVLATLYYSTDGDNWVSCFQDDDSCNFGSSWLTGDGSECAWAGVTCGDITGGVSDIELGE